MSFSSSRAFFSLLLLLASTFQSAYSIPVPKDDPTAINGAHALESNGLRPEIHTVSKHIPDFNKLQPRADQHHSGPSGGHDSNNESASSREHRNTTPNLSRRQQPGQRQPRRGQTWSGGDHLPPIHEGGSMTPTPPPVFVANHVNPPAPGFFLSHESGPPSPSEAPQSHPGFFLHHEGGPPSPAEAPTSHPPQGRDPWAHIRHTVNTPQNRNPWAHIQHTSNTHQEQHPVHHSPVQVPLAHPRPQRLQHPSARPSWLQEHTLHRHPPPPASNHPTTEHGGSPPPYHQVPALQSSQSSAFARVSKRPATPWPIGHNGRPFRVKDPVDSSPAPSPPLPWSPSAGGQRFRSPSRSPTMPR